MVSGHTVGEKKEKNKPRPGGAFRVGGGNQRDTERRREIEREREREREVVVDAAWFNMLYLLTLSRYLYDRVQQDIKGAPRAM
jgi:hypothetical protein